MVFLKSYKHELYISSTTARRHAYCGSSTLQLFDDYVASRFVSVSIFSIPLNMAAKCRLLRSRHVVDIRLLH